VYADIFNRALTHS